MYFLDNVKVIITSVLFGDSPSILKYEIVDYHSHYFLSTTLWKAAVNSLETEPMVILTNVFSLT